MRYIEILGLEPNPFCGGNDLIMGLASDRHESSSPRFPRHNQPPCSIVSVVVLVGLIVPLDRERCGDTCLL